MKKKFNPNRYFEKYDPSGKRYDPKQEYMIQSQKRTAYSRAVLFSHRR